MLKTINTIALALAFASCASTSAAQPANKARTEAGQQAGPARTAQPAQPKQAKPRAKTAADPMESDAADRQAVEVTIYNNDLSLVKEQRGITVAAGEGALRFIDVPSLINPATVHIKPLGNAPDFTVLEQNYEYDLISHAKLLDKYVGKNIKIMSWNEYQDRKEIVDAELLSASSGEVYKIDGEIYLGHPGIKILPEIPGNLISRPTLSWIYSSKSGREQLIEVSYLTAGMSWNADYILVIADGRAGAGLSGWVTVNNHSGAEYEGAKLKLVAGNVNRVRPEMAGVGRRNMAMAMKSVDAAAPAFAQSEVFEYHMYDLQRPTTIKNNQTKQISLMEARGVEVVREYTTTASDFFSPDGRSEEPVKQPVTAFLKFRNTKENNLGNPLPAGTVRIYTADAGGSQQFIGEDRIAHTPGGEEIVLRAGEVFDVVAERTHVSFRQISAQRREAEWSVTIRNRKNEDVTVGVIENAHGTWEIVESTHKHTKVNATTFRFDVPVGKGKEVTVKYKIRTGI